jgi:biotin carboxyl carrier protein
MRITSCVNDDCFEIDYRVDPRKEGRFVATIGGREIELELIERKVDSMTLSVNGHVGFYEFAKDKGRIASVVYSNRTCKVEVKNQQQEQLEELLVAFGGELGSGTGANTVIAPMPGKVLALRVSPGDKVEAGQVLLVLEAMKMENEIGSPGEGVVRTVKCEPGGNVNTGDVLIEFEAR